MAKHAFLDSPPAALASAVAAERRDAEPTAEWTGRRLGAYRIIREIGRGGMARVFLAERALGDFEQRVAVKLLRPGLDTPIDRSRFRAEQQILAWLDHPSIARLLDGGVTPEGQPYLILEFVDGQSIDAYCEERGLGVRQRLQLFLTVLDAVQYAHRNLIVHRDLKPSNILIDRDGRVKLLDFGLAKLLQPTSPPDPLLSHTHQRWLTPEYAAPEQILGRRVSTLTDVYQLGAVLYRLLAGMPPFSRDASVHEVEASVLGREPDLPSVAADRSSPGQGRQVRGDLDAIVLKALGKDPDERYATAESLGDDVRRHLTGLPVLARRQTAGYRARRFARRHRRETIAAVGIALSLVAGASIAGVEARRTAIQRDRAEAASRDAAGVTNFVLGLFDASDPGEARGDTLTASELVRRGVTRAARMDGNPAQVASMLEITSRLYIGLGRYDESHTVLERALALRRGRGRPDNLEVAATLRQLALSLRSLGRYAEADSVARKAFDIQRRILGSRDPALAYTLHQLGSLSVYRGDLITAEDLHRRALALRISALGAEDSLTGVSHLYLGSILRSRGRADDAEREFRRALSIFERVGAPEQELAQATMQIAYLLAAQASRRAEAEPLFRRGLEIRRRVYGRDHPMTASALGDLADYLSQSGNLAEAVPMARSQLRILERAYGDEHPSTAAAFSTLALVLARAGEAAEAEDLFRRALAVERRVHGDVAGREINLAELLIDRGSYAEAEPLLRDALRIRTRLAGPESPNTAYARGLLGRLLTLTGDYAAADTLLHGAIGTTERQVLPSQPSVRQLRGWLTALDSARSRAAGSGGLR